VSMPRSLREIVGAIEGSAFEVEFGVDYDVADHQLPPPFAPAIETLMRKVWGVEAGRVGCNARVCAKR
jgi:hypothetical protein